MGHFNNNFLLNFSDDFFFLNHRHFHNLFFDDSVRHNLFNDFSHIHFPFFGVGDESWDFSIQVDSFPIGNNMRDLSLDFNVSVSLEYFFIYNLDFSDFLFSLSYVDWLFDYLLYFDVLFWARHFNSLLHLDYFGSLHNNVFVVFYFHYFFFIKRDDFFHFDVI